MTAKMQEFAQRVPDPLSKKVGSGNETTLSGNISGGHATVH